MKTNCKVIQTGEKKCDHSHVKKVSPIDTKREEMENDPKYKTPFQGGIDSKRVKDTRERRAFGRVRPLGGK